MGLQYASSIQTTPSYVHESTNLEFLDDIYVQLLEGSVENALNELGYHLHELYATTSVDEWEAVLQNYLLRHPIKELLMQDPLTYRSFTQPRGYAGDAVLIDMVYFPGRTDVSATSDIGKQIYKYTTRTPLSRNLVKRMKTVAGYLDDVAGRVENPRILSVASGHCRELEFAENFKAKSEYQFFALDHDSESLNTATRDYGEFGIKALNNSISDVIKGRLDLGKFDLIYAAGLYDYLGSRIAKRLTSEFFNMLTEGGKFVLMNINADYEEIGYMESYMNWSMIGRTKGETLELASEVESSESANIVVQDRADISSHYHILEISRN